MDKRKSLDPARRRHHFSVPAWMFRSCSCCSPAWHHSSFLPTTSAIAPKESPSSWAESPSAFWADRAHHARCSSAPSLVLSALSPALAIAQDLAAAYVNESARELVRLARQHRDLVDGRIASYTTTVRERKELRARTGVMERMLYWHEMVTRVRWERDGAVRMEVLGARGATPLLKAGTRAPDGDEFGRLLPDLIYDPTNPDALLLFDSTVVRHPLASDGEQHYRFAAGDTTVIRLPDGRTLPLHELRIIPRRRDPQLINGSFWLEAGSHALVRAYFKLARAYDGDLDGKSLAALSHFIGLHAIGDRLDDRGGERYPGLLKPVRVELDYVALDYALWHSHWWLPRRVAWQGIAQLGSIQVPASYERTYETYSVHGDTAAPLLARPDSLPRSCRFRNVHFRVSPADSAATDSARQVYFDSIRARRAQQEQLLAKRRAELFGNNPPVNYCIGPEVIMTAPAESVLLNSPALSPVHTNDATQIGERGLGEIIRQVQAIPDPPCCSLAPRLQWGPTGPNLLRYNRVEGLSVGARVTQQLSASTALETVARIGSADRTLRGEAAVDRRGDLVHSRFAAYRGLPTVMPSIMTHGTLASLGALASSRDDADYFDAMGTEITVRPPELRRQWYDLRLYAERQRAVDRNTSFSIAHFLDSDRDFRDNFVADAADQIGVRLRLRGSFGTSPGVSVSGEVSLGAETGDYRILRPEASLRITAPLLFGLSLGLEGAAGSVEGPDIPTQALWRLGGASTLRGYAVNTLVGERYWRVRAELGSGGQIGLIPFADAAWAGPHNRFNVEDAHFSVGIGLSFFDGLVRLDLARRLQLADGWRLHGHSNWLR
jgi:hypothetical protein